MKEKKIFDAITEVSDELVEEAYVTPLQKKKTFHWKKWVLLAASFLLIFMFAGRIKNMISLPIGGAGAGDEQIVYRSDVSEIRKEDIDFSKAVKTASYTPKEMLELLSSSDLISEIEGWEKYCWKIPVVNEGEDVLSYIVVSVDENDKWTQYEVKVEDDFAKEQVEYLFDETLIDRLISENEMKNVEKVYTVSVSADVNADLIIIVTDEECYVIPFAVRPDFMGITNKKAYTVEEMSEIMNTYLQTQKESSRNAWKGVIFYFLPLIVLLILLLGIVLLIVGIWKEKKRMQ